MRLLFLIAIVSLSISAFGISWLSGTPPSATVEAEIGDARFSYKRAYARDAATAAGGSSDRLAFAVSFPEFAPLSSPEKPVPLEVSDERRNRTVFVTVSQADEAVDPADRPALLYSRFLEGDATSGPGGLVMRKFESGSPYELETLYLAPPDGRVFFARCPLQRNAEDALLDLCLSVFRTKSLDVELRFAPALLEHWETLAGDARAFLSSIRVHVPERL
jgi:hypothetical protein